MTRALQHNARDCAAGACLSIAALLLTMSCAVAASDLPRTTLRLTRTGAAQPVFRWETMRCEEWDVPDTGARAWRDTEGHTHLLASDTANRAMVGDDLDHVKQDCRIVFKGGEKDDPSQFDDRSWLAGTYTLDGRDVVALVHNEFHGQLRPALCPTRDYEKCWGNAITLATSHDGGLSFSHATAPLHYVAGVPYRYRGDAGHRVGYFNPSNIVRRDGYYYAFFWAEEEGAQPRGDCLMRTADLANPRAWRAWDGQAFTIAFADPYTENGKNEASHVCAPVGAGALVSFVSSLTLHRPSGLYIALMATNHAIEPSQQALAGVFASTSPDLIHWSQPILLWQSPLLFKYDCADREAIAYPSLLDPQSPTRNFEDTGDHAYIYLTEIHLSACRIGPNRDLVRIPIDISTSIGAAP